MNSYLENFKTEYKIINEKEYEVLGILDSRTNKKMLSFIEDEKYIYKIPENVTMLFASEKIIDLLPDHIGIIVTENPRVEFFKFHNFLSETKEYNRAKVKTKLGRNCCISKLSFISSNNVVIGDNVIIEEFVSIKENTIIDDNSIIRAGSVLGSSGFEYKRIDDELMPVYHCGGVKIGSHVEIKCNTVIDKAIYPWDNTIVGDYTKIDNLVHIGHACKIGNRVMIPANSVIGGRVEIGDDSWVGIGSSIRNGIRIGKKARCNMGSVVTKDVKDYSQVTGNFAIEHKQFIENLKNANMQGGKKK